MSFATTTAMPRSPQNLGELAGRPSVAAFLLMTLYPIFLQVANYPIPVAGVIGGTRSLDLYYLSFALIVTLVCIGTGSVRLVMPPALFTSGAILWVGMNLASMIVNQVDVIVFQYLVLKFAFKVAFAFMFLWVAFSSGQLKRFMAIYVATCFLVGLITYGYALAGGSLTELRGMSYMTADSYTGQADEISAYRGLVRQGAGNLVPVFFTILFLMESKKGAVRSLCLALLPYFVILAALPLRREVLVESMVAALILIPAAPKRYRLWVIVSAALTLVVLGWFVSQSREWYLRGVETLQTLETGRDPRLVMLKMGPVETMKAPLFGHGPASFMMVSSQYFRSGIRMAAHNSFLRAAIETGIPGFVAMLMIYGSLPLELLRSWRQSSEFGRRLWLFVALITLHVGVLLNFGDGVTINPPWMWMGLAFAACRILRRMGGRAEFGVAPRPFATAGAYRPSDRYAELPAAIAGRG